MVIIMNEHIFLNRKPLLFVLITFTCICVHGQQPAQGHTTSSSAVDWTNETFTSNITLDTEKAGIVMPSGKNAANTQIALQIPNLIKDPLLSLYINSSQQLGDLVLDETITLEQLTSIIDNSTKAPGIFASGGSSIKTTHSLNLYTVGSLLIKHHIPFKNPRPIEQTASRIYSGIIIDARGSLPVHGEFINDTAEPCFFPEIWDENMNSLYERNMGSPELEKKQGMVKYDWSDDESRYTDRIGADPLHINARQVYGQFRTDPVISREDALKILTIPANLDLIRDGKVVILLDKQKLIHPVGAPEKNAAYYIAYREIRQHLYTDETGPIIQDTYKGIQLLYDIKFKADSPQLLQSELPKIQKLAETLKKINEDNAFTILVEGHTADMNKPEGQMQLSVSRTQTIIAELVAAGLDRSLFSYRGYGATQPVASNKTTEGRAQNRRVIITARPKATYIQRN
jgi:outer membrane protein OmpA-like peptidoglycan-associated protein